MSEQLVLHRGGWSASLTDLACVPVPDATDSYVPVPYPRLIEEIKLHLPRFGLTLTREEYGLAREGSQMFGVLSCRNGQPDRDHGLALGVRSSYDRSLAVGLVAGSRVFCCDNLAFSAAAAQAHGPCLSGPAGPHLQDALAGGTTPAAPGTRDPGHEGDRHGTGVGTPPHGRGGQALHLAGLAAAESAAGMGVAAT